MTHFPHAFEQGAVQQHRRTCAMPYHSRLSHSLRPVIAVQWPQVPPLARHRLSSAAGFTPASDPPPLHPLSP